MIEQGNCTWIQKKIEITKQDITLKKATLCVTYTTILNVNDYSMKDKLDRKNSTEHVQNICSL